MGCYQTCNCSSRGTITQKGRGWGHLHRMQTRKKEWNCLWGMMAARNKWREFAEVPIFFPNSTNISCKILPSKVFRYEFWLIRLVKPRFISHVGYIRITMNYLSKQRYRVIEQIRQITNSLSEEWMRVNIWIAYNTRFIRKSEDFCNTNKWKSKGWKDDNINTMRFQTNLIINTTGQKPEKL